MRGDDGAGPAAAALADCPAWRVEPTRLLDHLPGLDALVVVDGILGPPPGQVDVWTVDRAVESALPEKGVSHLMGLREALLLAKALGMLPPFCAVVTIGIDSTGQGQDLSPVVQAGVREAAKTAASLLKTKVIS